MPRAAAPLGAEPVADAASLLRRAGEAADFLKALAHQNRLLLLCLLSEQERTVGELEVLLALPQPTVSQQLARLRAEGFVSARRDGKSVIYSLASDDVRQVIGVIHDIFCRPAADKA